MMTHKILNRDPKAPTPPDSPKASEANPSRCPPFRWRALLLGAKKLLY